MVNHKQQALVLSPEGVEDRANESSHFKIYFFKTCDEHSLIHDVFLTTPSLRSISLIQSPNFLRSTRSFNETDRTYSSLRPLVLIASAEENLAWKLQTTSSLSHTGGGGTRPCYVSPLLVPSFSSFAFYSIQTTLDSCFCYGFTLFYRKQTIVILGNNTFYSLLNL